MVVIDFETFLPFGICTSADSAPLFSAAGGVTRNVTRASSPLVKIGTRDYGLGWWIYDLPYGNRTLRGFAALGNGGQNLFVVPDLDLVVAVYASNYGDRVLFEIQNDLVPKQILPAVREAGRDRTSASASVPYGWPRDSHCPQVIEELAGVNGLMVCGPQQKIARGSHIANLRAIHFDRREVVRRKTIEKIQILLVKGRREAQLVAHTRARTPAKR